MSRGIFVTGTDTGVGKTVVTAGLVRWLRQRGIDAVPVKPVQTGAVRQGSRLVSPDIEFCLAVAGITPDDDEMRLMSPYLYEPACSPHLAGRLAQSYADISQIVDCADKLLQKHRVLVFEGAGGVLAPLNERQTMLDLMAVLNYPVIVVSRFGLGTINHTLLSVRTLRAAGLDPLGVVFNRTEPPRSEDRFIEEDNPETITRFGQVAVLGRLNYFDNLELSNQEVWQDFETNMPGIERILDCI